MKIEITDEQLKRMHGTNAALTRDNEDGQGFEFWQVVDLLDLSDEILAEAIKGGWVPPPAEDDDEETESDEG